MVRPRNEDGPEYAAWLKKNIKLLLDSIGASEPKDCKSACGTKIRFIVTKNNQRAPITAEGLNHFADCPNAARFRS